MLSFVNIFDISRKLLGPADMDVKYVVSGH